MMELHDIHDALLGHINGDDGCCVLPSSNGYVGESTLLCTEDGGLKLAAALIKMVIKNRKCIDASEDRWSDSIKDVFLQLPNDDAWIVGSYVFKTKKEMLSTLIDILEYDQDAVKGIASDPEFQIEQGDSSDAFGAADL